MISPFHFAIQKMNEVAKKRGKGSTEESELLEQHLVKERQERSTFLSTYRPVFFVGLKKELDKQITELNVHIYAHDDFIKLSGSQTSLQDILITSNIENYFGKETCIEVGVSLMGEILEIIHRPKGKPEKATDLYLISAYGGLRVVNDSISYDTQEFAKSLIEKFLKERQALRDGVDIEDDD